MEIKINKTTEIPELKIGDLYQNLNTKEYLLILHPKYGESDDINVLNLSSNEIRRYSNSAIKQGFLQFVADNSQLVLSVKEKTSN